MFLATIQPRPHQNADNETPGRHHNESQRTPPTTNNQASAQADAQVRVGIVIVEVRGGAVVICAGAAAVRGGLMVWHGGAAVRRHVQMWADGGMEAAMARAQAQAEAKLAANT